MKVKSICTLSEAIHFLAFDALPYENEATFNIEYPEIAELEELTSDNWSSQYDQRIMMQLAEGQLDGDIFAARNLEQLDAEKQKLLDIYRLPRADLVKISNYEETCFEALIEVLFNLVENNLTAYGLMHRFTNLSPSQIKKKRYELIKELSINGKFLKPDISQMNKIPNQLFQDKFLEVSRPHNYAYIIDLGAVPDNAI